MSQVAIRDDRTHAIEQKINQQVSSAISVGVGGITFQNAGEVMEFAKMMAVSGSAVPKHLRGQPGACLGIIDDAIRFQMSPYSLARKSYFVNDNLAYEAQVIAGIINAFAPLKERPNVEYRGEGTDRKCIVTFNFKDGAVRTYESPKFKDIHPKNSPLWKTDPDQQQAYYSLRACARRHCPEVILGIYDVEEMRSIDLTPEQPSVMQRLQRQEASPEREGFDPAHVTRETAALSGEVGREQETTIQEPSDQPHSSDEGSGLDETSHEVAVTLSEPAEAADPEAGEPEVEQETLPASNLTPALTRMILEECVDNMLRDAFSEPAIERPAKVDKLEATFLALPELADHKHFVETCAETARRVIGKPTEKARAREYLIGRLPA